MQTTETKITSSENILFLKDVEKGLSAKEKYLPSKYFYDERGDALFIQIMNMPEYYLTNAELDIFKNQTEALITALNLPLEQEFDLIELGAGDGTKTKELLKVLSSKGFKFTFIPIDISQNALNNLENSVKEELPEIKLTPKQGHYFNVLNEIKLYHKPKVVLFLGSNIGNLEDNQAMDFITEDSLIVLDDIHWSQEMGKVWETISNDPRVTLSIDLYQFGLLFFKKGMEKQKYVLAF